jgi:hypothetical protein
MAVSRVKTSSVLQGFPKYRSMLGGNAAFNPSSFESIATATGTGSSITFSSIPSTYKSLQIRTLYKDSSTNSAQEAPLYIYFNGDTSGSYAYHYLRGDGSSATASGVASTTWMRVDGAGVVSTTGAYGTSIIDIIDYASTTKNKTMRALAGGNGNTTGTNYMVSLSSGVWLNTSAVTSVTVYAGNAGFASGSSIALYGIK